MLAGDHHEWIGFMARFALALVIIMILALPLLDYLTR